jgi:superfamily I DNA/RNA helicase
MDATPQQQNVISFVEKGRGNGEVIARAGTGKTTLLLMAAPFMQGRVICTAYNTDIAAELDAKAKKLGLFHMEVKTSHAAGLRTWKKVAQRVKIDLGGGEWFGEISRHLELSKEVKPFVRAAMNFARQRAFGILCPLNDPNAWLKLCDDYNLAEKLFADPGAVPPAQRDAMLKMAMKLSCKAVKYSLEIADRIIDGDGMIFAPLAKGAIYDTYDWGVMDEAQDVNPLRRVQFKRMLKPGARCLFVGDPRQAINAWAGADSDSMDLIHREFNTKRFPLTVTWRCPKVVVQRAQAIVPDYQAAPQAPEGRTSSVLLEKFLQVTNLKKLRPGQDVVICRNTRPLVDLAFAMVAKNIPCHIEGKKLAAPLVAMATRWGDATPDIETLRPKVAEYLTRETQRLMSLDQEDAADRLTDQVEALYAFMEGMPVTTPIDKLKAKITSMFADTKKGGKPHGITLMTAHKSKGLEFPRVFLLGANRYMPSKHARTAAAMEQEQNLIYVAWTRAQEELVDIIVPLPGDKG